MNPLDVWCPKCGAQAGFPCKEVNRQSQQPQDHRPRWDNSHMRRKDVAYGYQLGWNAAIRAYLKAARKLVLSS